jgi:hypothetical protein
MVSHAARRALQHDRGPRAPKELPMWEGALLPSCEGQNQQVGFTRS